jgi:hypothetical protein
MHRIVHSVEQLESERNVVFGRWVRITTLKVHREEGEECGGGGQPPNLLLKENIFPALDLCTDHKQTGGHAAKICPAFWPRHFFPTTWNVGMCFGAKYCGEIFRVL